MTGMSRSTISAFTEVGVRYAVPADGPPRPSPRNRDRTACRGRRARAVAEGRVPPRSQQSPGCRVSAGCPRVRGGQSIRWPWEGSGQEESETVAFHRLTGGPPRRQRLSRTPCPATREMCSTDARVAGHPLRRGLGDASGARAGYVSRNLSDPTRPLVADCCASTRSPPGHHWARRLLRL